MANEIDPATLHRPTHRLFDEFGDPISPTQHLPKGHLPKVRLTLDHLDHIPAAYQGPFTMLHLKR